MSPRSVVLLGSPGIGKSALIGAVREELGPGEPVSWGLLHAERYPQQRLLLLGCWQAATRFPGADQLHPEANEWLQLLLRDAPRLLGPGWTLLWDGPWATSITLGVAHNRGDCHLIRLWAPPAVLAERRERRGQPHDLDWLNGMEARVETTAKRWRAAEWRHAGPEDATANLLKLRTLLGLVAE